MVRSDRKLSAGGGQVRRLRSLRGLRRLRGVSRTGGKRRLGGRRRWRIARGRGLGGAAGRARRSRREVLPNRVYGAAAHPVDPVAAQQVSAVAALASQKSIVVCGELSSTKQVIFPTGGGGEAP